jgi:hypothetical protein
MAAASGEAQAGRDDAAEVRLVVPVDRVDRLEDGELRRSRSSALGKNGLVGATDTVVCMIAFHSVTASVCAAEAMLGASAMLKGSTRASANFDFILLMVITLSRLCARNLARLAAPCVAKGAAGCGLPNVGRRQVASALSARDQGCLRAKRNESARLFRQLATAAVQAWHPDASGSLRRRTCGRQGPIDRGPQAPPCFAFRLRQLVEAITHGREVGILPPVLERCHEPDGALLARGEIGTEPLERPAAPFRGVRSTSGRLPATPSRRRS